MSNGSITTTTTERNATMIHIHPHPSKMLKAMVFDPLNLFWSISKQTMTLGA